MDIPREKKNRRALKLTLGGVGIALVVFVTVALSQLEPAAPSIDRAGIWMDTVERGSMVRQVRGTGTLVPEQTRYISSITAGRVERILIAPGTEVTAETPLFVLSNPQVQLDAMEAQRALANSRAKLVELEANLENQRLNQESALASTRSQYREAARRAEANRGLAARGIPLLDVQKTDDDELQLKERLELDERRLQFLAASMDAQLAAQRSEIERLESLSAFKQSYVDGMIVTAGTVGILRELALQPGQALQEGEWVSMGARVAVVVQPGRLKAELRIPETQIRDVAIGQSASIDTRNGIVAGRVTRVDPAVSNGTVLVDVALEGELPRGARPDLSVDGMIEVERLDDVIHAGRPAYGQAESTIGIFRVDADGKFARRTSVVLGRTSVNDVEIRGGLNPGDVVILSDVSQWDGYDRIRLK